MRGRHRLLVLAAAIAGVPLGAQTPPLTPAPVVAVWVVQSDHPRAAFSASTGAFVVVIAVERNKGVHVLYPSSPKAQAPFPANVGSLSVPLSVAAYGSGEVYAIVSNSPFALDKVGKDDHWNTSSLPFQPVSDLPYAAERFFSRIVPPASVVALDEAGFVGPAAARAFAMLKGSPVYASPDARKDYAYPALSADENSCFMLQNGRCGSIAQVFAQFKTVVPAATPRK